MTATTGKPLQPSAKPGPPVLDPAILDQATFGDRALRDEVVGMFIAQAPGIMAGIRAASDLCARSDLAHRLLGSARALGCLAVARAAETVEACPDDPGGVEALAGAVEAAMRALRHLCGD